MTHTFNVAGRKVHQTSVDAGARWMRVIRPDENPALGVFAKNPSAVYAIEGHILNGTRPGWASQYISTTGDLSVAQSWATPPDLMHSWVRSVIML